LLWTLLKRLFAFLSLMTITLIVRAQVFLAGSAVEFASATIDLAVPPKAHKLNLTVKSEQEFVAPGHETTIDIELKDWTGKPVNDGQVALAVVDESVCWP
jgi:uncharacterized protein YfaS (alpha-2-macroglobulin family)